MSENQCVSKWISELTRAHPNWTREQVIAVAFAKCRRGEGDAILIPNQVIAEEGVLPYPDGNKLKRWEDLRRNAGRIVPFLEGHPSEHNAAGGLYSGDEEIQGYAYIRADEKNRRLVADVYLLKRNLQSGYSIGFGYVPRAEKGSHNGMDYDEVQADLIVDHLAGTDTPRNENMLRILQDGRETQVLAVTGDATTSRGTVYISAVAHDSISLADGIDMSSDEVRRVMDKLRTVNPDVDEDELSIYAVNMVLNKRKKKDRQEQDEADMASEQPMEDEDEDEESCDEDMKMKEKRGDAIDVLTEHVAQLQRIVESVLVPSQKPARDANDAPGDTRVAQLEARVAQLDSQIKLQRIRELDSLKRGIMSATGLDEDAIADAMRTMAIDSDDEMPFLKGVEFARRVLVSASPLAGRAAGGDSLASPRYMGATKNALGEPEADTSHSIFGRVWDIENGGWK